VGNKMVVLEMDLAFLAEVLDSLEEVSEDLVE
jgi:hypothetical protein